MGRGTNVKPRAAKDLGDIVAAVNDGREKITDDLAFRIIIRARQILEVTREFPKYPRLSFFCDLTLHSQLTRAKHYSVLQRAAEYLELHANAENPPITYHLAIEFEEIFSELMQLLSQFCDSHILRDHDARQLVIVMLRAIDGTDVSCREAVTESDGSISVDKAETYKIVGSGSIVLSFGIRRWVSHTNLELFDCESELYVIDGKKNVYLRSPLMMGLCLHCGSQNFTPMLDWRTTCLACGAEHLAKAQAQRA